MVVFHLFNENKLRKKGTTIFGKIRFYINLHLSLLSFGLIWSKDETEKSKTTTRDRFD